MTIEGMTHLSAKPPRLGETENFQYFKHFIIYFYFFVTILECFPLRHIFYF